MSEVEILLVQEPPVTPREPARQVREPRRLRATACRESALRALAGASQLEFDFKLQQAATAVLAPTFSLPPFPSLCNGWMGSGQGMVTACSSAEKLHALCRQSRP